jgi:hypothetical protein
MKSTKCVVCTKVKGKRICQLHAGAFIYPRCCAQIRHADCEGCSYYTQAENYALTKTPRPNRQPFIIRIDPKVDEEVDDALAMIEKGAWLAGESMLVKLLKQHPDLHTVQQEPMQLEAGLEAEQTPQLRFTQHARTKAFQGKAFQDVAGNIVSHFSRTCCTISSGI